MMAVVAGRELAVEAEMGGSLVGPAAGQDMVPYVRKLGVRCEAQRWFVRLWARWTHMLRREAVAAWE